MDETTPSGLDGGIQGIVSRNYQDIKDRLLIVERKTTRHDAQLEFLTSLKHEERITRMERVFLGFFPITIAVTAWLIGNLPKIMSVMDAIK